MTVTLAFDTAEIIAPGSGFETPTATEVVFAVTGTVACNSVLETKVVATDVPPIWIDDEGTNPLPTTSTRKLRLFPTCVATTLLATGIGFQMLSLVVPTALAES